MILLPPKPHKRLPFSKPITNLQDHQEEQAIPKANWQQTAEERPDWTDRNVAIDRSGHTMPAQTMRQHINDIVIMENTAHKRKEEMPSICQQLGLTPDAWEEIYDEQHLKDVILYDKGEPNIVMDLTPEKIKEAIEIHINDVQDKRARRKVDNDRMIPKIDAFCVKHGIHGGSGQAVYDELKTQMI